MLKLPLTKLKELEKSLGTYIDYVSLNSKGAPFILIWAGKSKRNIHNHNNFVYLIDLISMRIIVEPYYVDEELTSIYTSAMGIEYEYWLFLEDDNVQTTDTISIRQFIPQGLCEQYNDTKESYWARVLGYNSYDKYISEILTLIDTKSKLSLINLTPTLDIKPFINSITSLSKNINEKLKDKIDNYPFDLINS